LCSELEILEIRGCRLYSLFSKEWPFDANEISWEKGKGSSANILCIKSNKAHLICHRRILIIFVVYKGKENMLKFLICFLKHIHRFLSDPKKKKPWHPHMIVCFFLFIFFVITSSNQILRSCTIKKHSTKLNFSSIVLIRYPWTHNFLQPNHHRNTTLHSIIKLRKYLHLSLNQKFIGPFTHHL
jgi:hypothetical protein